MSVFKRSGIRVTIASEKIIDDLFRLFRELWRGRTLFRRNVKVVHNFNFGLHCMAFTVSKRNQNRPNLSIIHLEIRYQKVVVNRRWYVDKKTGKRVYFSLNDRITFLKKIVAPGNSDNITQPVVDSTTFLSGLDQLHKEMLQYPHRTREVPRSSSQATHSRVVKSKVDNINGRECLIMFNEFSYLSVFFADEDRELYPSMISRIIHSSKCDYCKRLTVLQ